MIFGLNAMIVSHDFRNAVLSSTQMVILCKLGNPFIAASPQNKEPSHSKRDMESAVWPGVSIIFPCSKNSTCLRFRSLTWIHLHWYSCLNLGNKCPPLPASFMKEQKPKASRLVQPPRKEFCPLYNPSNALPLITIWVSGHSESISFRYPAWSSWACVKKIYRIC